MNFENSDPLASISKKASLNVKPFLSLYLRLSNSVMSYYHYYLDMKKESSFLQRESFGFVRETFVILIAFLFILFFEKKNQIFLKMFKDSIKSSLNHHLSQYHRRWSHHLYQTLLHRLLSM